MCLRRSTPRCAPVLWYVLPALLLVLCAGRPVSAKTIHVWTNSPTDGPGTAWSNAYHVIQTAVNAAVTNDTVLVTNGVYDSGGAVAAGYTLNSRVSISTNIAVVSVNGPEVTTIRGAADALGDLEGNGFFASRCAYLVDGASLTGFTLQDGHTKLSGGAWQNWAGGGALLDGGGILRRCIISGSSAKSYGGGVECNGGGTLESCLIVSNTAPQGGGVELFGGGALLNCTIVANEGVDGGGVKCFFGGAVSNSIVWGNTADSSDNIYLFGSGHTIAYTCTTPDPGGVSNITLNPQFFASGSGDYRLLYGSPCVDSGTNGMALGPDLDDRPRIVNATIDRGAYEYDGALYDSDGDGLVDDDELFLYGTSPLNSNTDGDPHGDYVEMLADTDGANSNDYFHIMNITTASSVTVMFNSSSNRIYWMESRSNLLSGAWSNVPGAGPRPGIGGSDSMIHSNAPLPSFYRLTLDTP